MSRNETTEASERDDRDPTARVYGAAADAIAEIRAVIDGPVRDLLNGKDQKR